MPHVVLQRRSLTKDTYPGRVDVAVGGHVGAGESTAETMREAREEIGLELTIDDVTFVGRRFVRSLPSDNEVQDIYAVRADLALAAFAPHPLEVDAMLRLPLADARRLVTGEASVVEALELPRGTTEPGTILLTADAFVPETGPYYALALDALERVVLGEAFEPFLLRPGRGATRSGA
ncbi:MAG: NUDIX domain-containing protein [Gaiellales bacterium]